MISRYLLAALACLLAVQQAPAAQSRALVFTNLTLIDATGAAAQPDMDVAISGNRITDVGRNLRLPAQAQVVDATGRFMIPGLWDMHIHIHRWDEFTILLANGVTGVRLMAFLPEYQKMVADIASGKVLGPRMALASRNMDGSMPNQPLPPAPGDTAGEEREFRLVETGQSIPLAMQVTTAAQAREAMAISRASGVKFVKIHNGLTREAYFAIAEEAKKQGLYLTGHAPTGVSARELSDSGMRSIEHFGGMLEGCSTREAELLKGSLEALPLPPAQRAQKNLELRRAAAESFSAEKCQALAAHLKRNNTWLSPTFMPEGGIKADRARAGDLGKYVPAALRARWEQQAAAAREPMPSAEEIAVGKLADAREREIVAIMKRAGVLFISGTDTGRPWRMSGFNVHETLAEMTRKGLTPMEAIQSATRNAAMLLGQDREWGTVQKGKLADLVLLDADPLQAIANTQKINGVVVNGRFLDRPTLDTMLSQLVATNAN